MFLYWSRLIESVDYGRIFSWCHHNGRRLVPELHRTCKCKKITAPTQQIERLFFYLMSRITRLSVTPLYKQYNILATTFQYVFVCYLYLETFKSKFHCPLMRWNLLLHEQSLIFHIFVLCSWRPSDSSRRRSP